MDIKKNVNISKGIKVNTDPKRIDEILEPVAEAFKGGGYIPFGDHLIPPEIHWKDFRYYREKLNDIISG